MINYLKWWIFSTFVFTKTQKILINLTFENDKYNIESAESIILGDSILCIGILGIEGIGYKHGGLYINDAVILHIDSKPTKYLIGNFFMTISKRKKSSQAIFVSLSQWN